MRPCLCYIWGALEKEGRLRPRASTIRYLSIKGNSNVTHNFTFRESSNINDSAISKPEKGGGTMYGKIILLLLIALWANPSKAAGKEILACNAVSSLWLLTHSFRMVNRVDVEAVEYLLNQELCHIIEVPDQYEGIRIGDCFPWHSRLFVNFCPFYVQGHATPYWLDTVTIHPWFR